MVNLNATIRLLHDRRHQLLQKLNAIERAIEALAPSDSAISPDPAVSLHQTKEQQDPPVVVVPPKRVLTEAHKDALREGRRRAREARLLLSRGLEPVKPAISIGPERLPRLVKRSKIREFTVGPVDGQQQPLVS